VRPSDSGNEKGGEQAHPMLGSGGFNAHMLYNGPVFRSRRPAVVTTTISADSSFHAQRLLCVMSRTLCMLVPSNRIRATSCSPCVPRLHDSHPMRWAPSEIH
jgi:hypothetical protein